VLAEIYIVMIFFLLASIYFLSTSQAIGWEERL